MPGYLVICPLESGGLRVLEIRRSGRQTVYIQKRRIEHPISGGWRIDVIAAFEWRIVVMRVEEIDQRTAVIQTSTAPVLEKTLEIMNASVHPQIAASLVWRAAQTRYRIARKHCEAGVSLACNPGSEIERSGETPRILP